MSFTVYVRRAAEIDVAEAQTWYEEQQSGLAMCSHVVSKSADFMATIDGVKYRVIHHWK